MFGKDAKDFGLSPKSPMAKHLRIALFKQRL